MLFRRPAAQACSDTAGLGPVEGHFTDWTPLTDRIDLFPDDVDPDDPWQFRNVLVH